jgi:hypothetical protein
MTDFFDDLERELRRAHRRDTERHASSRVFDLRRLPSLPATGLRALVALAVVVALVAVVVTVARESDVERPAAPPPQPNPTTAPGALQDTPPAYLATLPARKSCGHFRIAPPGDYPLILVEVVKGNVPCRMARRVLKTQYRNVPPESAAEAASPWRCSGPEGLVVCHTDPGPRHNLIRARFPGALQKARARIP